MKQKNLNLLLLALGLIFLGVISRLSAHAWNFTLMGGLALFAGAFFKRKWISAAIVFSTLLISDLVLGFHNQMPAVYLGFALMILIGAIMSVKPSRPTVVASALVASLIFFLVSNLFVWFEGTLYPQTWDGLVNCYVMAIPFYQNQIISDVISAFALFEVARAMKSFVVARFEQAEVNSL